MLLRDALELSLQAPQLIGLGIDSLALCLECAIVLRPDVQAVNAHPEPCRYFACWVTVESRLLERCNLEFLCVYRLTLISPPCA